MPPGFGGVFMDVFSAVNPPPPRAAEFRHIATIPAIFGLSKRAEEGGSSVNTIKPSVGYPHICSTNVPLTEPRPVPSRPTQCLNSQVASRIGFRTLLVTGDAAGVVAGGGESATPLPLERGLACFIGAIPHPEEWLVG